MSQKRLPADKRKKIIIRSAIKVFAGSNYRLAKVSEIAELAGVTEPMVYRYFHTKKNLFLEILKVISQRTIERIQIEAAEYLQSGLLFIEKATYNYLNSMDRFRNELKIYYQAISEIDDADIKMTLQNSYRSYAKFYENAVIKAINKGEISKDVDAMAWAWNMVGLLIHLSTYYLLDLYRKEDAELMIRQHIDLLR